MGSPVKSHDVHLFPCFSKKRHGKTRHVMGGRGISHPSHGNDGTKGGFIGTNNTVQEILFESTPGGF